MGLALWPATLSGTARRCTAEAEQKCPSGMMRKNQIGSLAGFGQEQGSSVLETVDIYGHVLPATDAQASAALEC